MATVVWTAKSGKEFLDYGANLPLTDAYALQAFNFCGPLDSALHSTSSYVDDFILARISLFQMWFENRLHVI